METTEKIVESYVRYIKGWFTIPNIKCAQNKEIDLIAVESSSSDTIHRYQIEVSVSISSTFAKLTANNFDPQLLKDRGKGPSQRRTIGYFADQKFGHKSVVSRLREHGFTPGNYHKVIVSWGWEDDVPSAAQALGIELWDMRQILAEIAGRAKLDSTYFVDDTIRTLQLSALAFEDEQAK